MLKRLRRTPGSQWSLSRRLLWITLGVVLGQSLISMAINHSLRQHLIDDVLRGTMQRQASLIFDEVNLQLKQSGSLKSNDCCTVEDYQSFLSQLKLSDGKVALIVGKAGFASSRSSKMLFDDQQLK